MDRSFFTEKERFELFGVFPISQKTVQINEIPSPSLRNTVPKKEKRAI